jgi:large subunit ribosomal protein L9
VPVELHGEVEVGVVVNVARNADEAARQARGEDLTVVRDEEEEERAQAAAGAEKFFEAPAAGEAAEGDRAKAEAAPAEAPAKPAREKKPRKEKAGKE